MINRARLPEHVNHISGDAQNHRLYTIGNYNAGIGPISDALKLYSFRLSYGWKKFEAHENYRLPNWRHAGPAVVTAGNRLPDIRVHAGL